jgi:hypothetical protein
VFTHKSNSLGSAPTPVFLNRSSANGLAYNLPEATISLG